MQKACKATIKTKVDFFEGSKQNAHVYIVFMIYLDWQGLPVSDHSAQLNHRLHLRDGALDAFVNQILPVRKDKKGPNGPC